MTSVFAGYAEAFDQPPFDAAALPTLEHVRGVVEEAYLAVREHHAPRALLHRYLAGSPLPVGGSLSSRLPAAVAEPSQLIAHAVGLGCDDGVPLALLRDVFAAMGQQRFQRGLELAQGRGLIHTAREVHLNRAGRSQQQIVARLGGCPSQPTRRG